jgi:hypothetical protein
LIVTVAPVSWVWAADGFVDVPPSNGHYNNINAIAEAGITLGCTDTSHYCPDTLVRRDQMASFLARLGGLGKNGRVANGKGAGSAYCAASFAHPGTFAGGPCTQTIRNLGAVGAMASSRPAVALAPSGLPIAAFVDGNGRLQFARCGDVACTNVTVNEIAIGSGSSLTTTVGLAIGSTGYPIITAARSISGRKDLLVAACTDDSCLGATGFSSTPASDFNAVVVPPDGRPVIFYAEDEGKTLRYLRCGGPLCNSVGTLTGGTVDGTANVGEYVSAAVGADGAPVVSYYDRGTGSLKYARCTPTGCTATTLVAGDGSNVGSHTSVAIGLDGVPLIAHYDFNAGALKLSRCTSVACAAATTVTLDGTPDAGRFASMTVGEDGIPVVSYYDAVAQNLKVVRCTTQLCSAATTPTVVVSDGDVGSNSALAMGLDGVPVIVFHDVTNAAIKVARVPRY